MVVHPNELKTTAIAIIHSASDFSAPVRSSGPSMYVSWSAFSYNPFIEYFRVRIYRDYIEKVLVAA